MGLVGKPVPGNGEEGSLVPANARQAQARRSRRTYSQGGAPDAAEPASHMRGVDATAAATSASDRFGESAMREIGDCSQPLRNRIARGSLPPRAVSATSSSNSPRSRAWRGHRRCGIPAGSDGQVYGEASRKIGDRSDTRAMMHRSCPNSSQAQSQTHDRPMPDVSASHRSEKEHGRRARLPASPHG